MYFPFVETRLNSSTFPYSSVTAAHEIGHGAYTLSHTFSPEVGLPQGSTNTLMDYSTGYGLLKFQWDVVHQPGNVWGVFEDDKEGLSLSDAGITADEQTGSQYNLSPNPTCSNFLTKAGYIVAPKKPCQAL